MSGTRAGGLKARDANLKKNPNFYRDIGRIGGKNGQTGGFASDFVGNDGLTGPQRAKIAGRKGGLISKRGKNLRRLRMKHNNETYELETIQDLLELHPDQLKRWFEDFKRLNEFAYKDPRKLILRKLTWKDDGKSEGTVTVNKPGGETEKTNV